MEYKLYQFGDVLCFVRLELCANHFDMEQRTARGLADFVVEKGVVHKNRLQGK